jgi:1-acyl-sn-glycerol-3-phosphate acyltransferase
MKKILDYLLTGVFLLYFFFILGVFHIIQVICYNVFGKKAHKASVDLLNFFIIAGYYLTGSTFSFKQTTELPKDRSIIFVANHQSTFDIPSLIWFLRKFTPIFVAKIELSKGIPSISYNLRKSQAALIDRKDNKQSITEILRLSKYIQENTYSAAIFPEGTRSRNGEMKPFAAGGISALLKKCPNALVVPIAIGGTGHFNPKGLFFRSFSKMSWTILTPIEPKGIPAEEVAKQAEDAIKTYKSLRLRSGNII